LKGGKTGESPQNSKEKRWMGEGGKRTSTKVLLNIERGVGVKLRFREKGKWGGGGRKPGGTRKKKGRGGTIDSPKCSSRTNELLNAKNLNERKNAISRQRMTWGDKVGKGGTFNVSRVTDYFVR